MPSLPSLSWGTPGSEIVCDGKVMTLEQVSEEKLLGMIKEGNHEAFTELVNRHGKRFYRTAYRLLYRKDDAEDIVQEAFLKLWERPHLFNEEKGAKFTTWFTRVVMNLSIDRNRKKGALPLEKEVAGTDEGGEEGDERKGRQALVESFLKKLPERQRVALTLCFFEGVSNKEAAVVMGISLKALQSLLMRGKSALKEMVRGKSRGGL